MGIGHAKDATTKQRSINIKVILKRGAIAHMSLLEEMDGLKIIHG